MKKMVLIGLILALASCYPLQAQIVNPLEEKELLQFLNDENWKPIQYCVEGECKEIVDYNTFPFGIETEIKRLNFCTDEEGDFYTIGKYYWSSNSTINNKINSINSDPEYFKITEICCNGKEAKIKLCTPSGYYSGKIKIIDEHTIQIISPRFEYDNREVVYVYKR